MFIKTTYQCEVCNGYFNNEKHALECESFKEPPLPTNIKLGEKYYSSDHKHWGMAIAAEFVLVNRSSIAVSLPGHRWEVRMDRAISDPDYGDPCMMSPEELEPWIPEEHL